MRVCIIAYTFYEVDFRVRRYADALMSAGYDVDVFALRRRGQKKRESLNGVNIYHLQEREYNEKGLRSFLFRMITFCLRVLFITSLKYLKSRYQIIHVHNPPDFLIFSVFLPKLLGAKVIFDMHENLPEFYCAKFGRDPDTFWVKVLLVVEKISTRFADSVIVAHDLLRERIIKRDGIKGGTCIALLNYPQISLFSGTSEKVEENGIRIVYPGTISYQHGIDIALKAMAIVKKEHKDIKLDIYTRSENSEYYKKLVGMINDLGLNRCVTFFEAVPIEELGKILSKATMGIVPKRGGIFGSEAFSTKILEFMAAGLPTIVSRTKIDEYYFDPSVVMFFEPEDHMALARCILELFRNPERRETLAKKGREFIEKNNWEIKSQIYFDIVNDLVGTTKSQEIK